MTSQITICSTSGFLGGFGIPVSDWMVPILHRPLATIIPFFLDYSFFMSLVCERGRVWVRVCVHLERVSVVCSQMQVCTLVIYVVCENNP